MALAEWFNDNFVNLFVSVGLPVFPFGKKPRDYVKTKSRGFPFGPGGAVKTGHGAVHPERLMRGASASELQEFAMRIVDMLAACFPTIPDDAVNALKDQVCIYLIILSHFVLSSRSSNVVLLC